MEINYNEKFIDFHRSQDLIRAVKSGRLLWSGYVVELQMVQLSTTRYNCIAILWASIVSFAAQTLCVASKRVYVFVVVYFVIDSVRKLLDTPSYVYIYIIRLRSFFQTHSYSYNRL